MLVTALLAAVPASAFADGAGDQQYQDPLTAPSTHKKVTKKATTAPTSTSQVAATQTASTTTPVSSAPASTTAPAAASQRQLPRTGAPAGLIALAGGMLVASGLALRRRTAE